MTLEATHYHDEATELAATWPIRRMVLEMPIDMRFEVLDNVEPSYELLTTANARFKVLANDQELGMLQSIGGPARALRYAISDLGTGRWDHEDYQEMRAS